MSDLRKAVEKALKFCKDIDDIYGPYSLWERGYSYKDINRIIFDSRILRLDLQEAIEKIDEALAKAKERS